MSSRGHRAAGNAVSVGAGPRAVSKGAGGNATLRFASRLNVPCRVYTEAKTNANLYNLSMTEPRAANLCQSIHRHIQTLLEQMPAVLDGLGSDAPRFPENGTPAKTLTELDAWQAMQKRHSAFLAEGDQPTLVAVLYGPTGAGKSTLFRLLTGIEVPAGAVRPTSYGPAAGVPERLDSQESIHRLLPDYEPVRLDDPNQLRDQHLPEERLYFRKYDPPSAHAPSATPTNLVLVDLPDFNSVERANRSKAEGLLKRAEMVLFVVYDESYKNEDVVRELARCCRLAGRMSYVLTKCDEEDARGHWDDLLAHVRERDPEFQQRRVDGQALHEFLARSPVYFSPRSKTPKLEDMRPLEVSAPGFRSLLQGEDAVKLVLWGVLEPTAGVVPCCGKLLEQVPQTLRRLEECDRQAVADCLRMARKGETFPLGEMLGLIVDEVYRRRQWWVKMLTIPIAGFAYLGRKLFKTMRELLKNRQKGLQPNRKDLERQLLSQAVRELTHLWRERHGEWNTPEGLLGSRSAETAQVVFARADLPPISREWEDFVREEVRKWAQANPLHSAALAAGGDLLAAGGIATMAVDLAFFGGMATVLVGGGLAGAMGIIMKAFEEVGIWKDTQASLQAWCELRGTQLGEHLQRHYYQPLLGRYWQERRQRLNAVPVQPCRAALAGLQEAIQQVMEGKTSE